MIDTYTGTVLMILGALVLVLVLAVGIWTIIGIVVLMYRDRNGEDVTLKKDRNNGSK